MGTIFNWYVPRPGTLCGDVREGQVCTFYTLEVTPAVHVTRAANEAEKAAPIRIVGLGIDGAVGRLRLAGTDAEIDAAVKAVRRSLEEARAEPVGAGRP